MTLERAIQHLKRKVNQNVFEVDPEALEAIKLGIEALKRIEWYRNLNQAWTIEPLLGETIED